MNFSTDSVEKYNFKKLHLGDRKVVLKNMQSKNTILRLVGSKKIYVFILLFALGAILLIFFTGGGNDSEHLGERVEALDPGEYAKSVEEQVEALCNRIDGVSGAYAVVTLKGGYQAIYAIDSQSSSSSNKNQIVVIGSGSNEQAILRGYEYPEIAGIGVVCDGGDSYDIKNKIVTLIASTFNLSANKIFVVGS